MKLSKKFTHMVAFASLFVCFNTFAQNIHASDVAKSRSHGMQGCVQSEKSCDMPVANKSMKSAEMDAQKPNQGNRKMTHKQVKKNHIDNKMKDKRKNFAKDIKDVEGIHPMNHK